MQISLGKKTFRLNSSNNILFEQPYTSTLQMKISLSTFNGLKKAKFCTLLKK